MDGGALWAAVHGVAKSQTRLSDFTFTFHFHALETKEKWGKWKQLADLTLYTASRLTGEHAAVRNAFPP